MKRFLLTMIALSFILLTSAHAAEKEPTYDRVMRTGTIRCGYGLWGSYLSKDPNTGKMKGIFYDYMEALGKGLGLKVEWTEEVGWGDYISGLVNDRFDAYCTIVAYNAERARQVDFITPLFYLSSSIFVREGDTRFDGHPEKLNEAGITLATVEGDVYDKMAAREFPKAKKLQLPQLATSADLCLSVTNRKADAIIIETTTGLDFMKHNPDKIRMVKLKGPFRYLPASISIKGGDYRFQRMLDIATIELISNGVMDHILDQNEEYKGTNLRIAKPYEMSK